DQAAKDKALQCMATMSSAQILSANAFQSKLALQALPRPAYPAATGSNPTFSDPYLEAVDIRQIYDKFPEKKGGLKDLFEKGPVNAFFLVKFWVHMAEDARADIATQLQN
ncbi:Transcriptional enhancer factor TEF-3, partial [Acipenser ruthenus]